jgi:hypothetical protein
MMGDAIIRLSFCVVLISRSKSTHKMAPKAGNNRYFSARSKAEGQKSKLSTRGAD